MATCLSLKGIVFHRPWTNNQGTILSWCLLDLRIIGVVFYYFPEILVEEPGETLLMKGIHLYSSIPIITSSYVKYVTYLIKYDLTSFPNRQLHVQS